MDALVADDEVDLDQDGNIAEAAPYDLGGSARILGTVDMGAYEAILPMLIDSEPADEGTLWRTQKNIVRLTFTDDITTPGSGDVTIRKLLANGLFDSDLSANFTFTVENDEDDDPRILMIQEDASTLADETWYAIQNEGDWAGVATFKVDLLDRRGDCDGNGIVLSLDVGCVNAAIPCFSGCGDDRREDMDGSGTIISLDVGIVNGYLDPQTISKPSGH